MFMSRGAPASSVKVTKIAKANEIPRLCCLIFLYLRHDVFPVYIRTAVIVLSLHRLDIAASVFVGGCMSYFLFSQAW